MPGLAGRLGYTPRHLTRVLASELGAGPLARAGAAAQTARALLTSTSMRVADVAFASGFGSIRQFNDTIRAVYERSRSSCARPHAPSLASGADAGVVRLRLPARPRSTPRACSLARRARSPASRRPARPLRTHARAADRTRARLAAAPDAPPIDVEARLASLADLAPLVARVRRLFDLDADAIAIDAALAADPALAPSVAANPASGMPGTLDPHELVVQALIGQQVSVASARTSLTRLAAELGERVAFDAARALFPTPGAIAAEGAAVLRGPAARIRTIVDVCDGSRGELVVAPERERADLRADLLATPASARGPPGTSRCASRASPTSCSCPTWRSERRGATRTPGRGEGAATRGEAWAPWRSYASMHLWRAAASA